VCRLAHPPEGGHPGVTIVENPEELVAKLRAKPGKDVWRFGGGSLFRSLAEVGLVDTVEVAVIPVLLGEGVSLLPAPAKRVRLKLIGHKLYAKTGILSLECAVQYGQAAKRRR
jgi:dihydrofolate reductase